MSLDLQVNHIRKSKVFFAGDTVSGTVLLRGPLDATVILSIRLKGKSQTLIKQSNGQTTSRYSDKVRFFTHIATLHHGVCSFARNDTIPHLFSFQLPLLTKPTGGNSSICRSNDAPYAQVAHALPPSFAAQGLTWTKKYEAQILYELRAELRYPNATFSSTTKEKCHLPLALHCLSAALLDPQLLTQRETLTRTGSALLLSTQPSGSRSLKTWASDTFSNKRPRATFTLFVTAPTVLLPGQAIPLTLCYAFDAQRSSGVPTAPVFRLRSVRYDFKEYTFVRGHAIFENTVRESETVFVRLISFDAVLTSGEVYSIGKKEKVALPAGSVGPSFQSYAICRRHAAELAVRFEVGGKEEERVFEWVVEVLPWEVKGE